MTLTPEQKKNIPQLILTGKTLEDISINISAVQLYQDQAWDAFVEHISVHTMLPVDEMDMDDMEFYVKLLTQLN